MRRARKAKLTRRRLERLNNKFIREHFGEPTPDEETRTYEVKIATYPQLAISLPGFNVIKYPPRHPSVRAAIRSANFRAKVDEVLRRADELESGVIRFEVGRTVTYPDDFLDKKARRRLRRAQARRGPGPTATVTAIDHDAGTITVSTRPVAEPNQER